MAEAQAQYLEDDDTSTGFPPDPDAPDIEVEVVDDVPEKDKRSRPTGDRLDVDSEEFNTEVETYSEDVQKRIKAMKYEFHEERRAKEAAQRTSEEAVKYAEAVSHDNSALKGALDTSNTAMISEIGARSDAELEQAKANFKTAYESGDTDALVEAQGEMSRIQAEKVRNMQVKEQAEASHPAGGAPGQSQGQPQQASIAVPDAKATAWINDNMWFHTPGHEDMTGYAIGLHEKLVKSGLDPRYHEGYYEQINEGLRVAFPDFQFTSSGDEGRQGVKASAATRRKTPPPVGGPSRGGKPSRKVQLTASAVALARRLGLTTEQYARQVAKEMEPTDG